MSESNERYYDSVEHYDSIDFIVEEADRKRVELRAERDGATQLSVTVPSDTAIAIGKALIAKGEAVAQ